LQRRGYPAGRLVGVPEVAASRDGVRVIRAEHLLAVCQGPLVVPDRLLDPPVSRGRVGQFLPRGGGLRVLRAPDPLAVGESPLVQPHRVAGLVPRAVGGGELVPCQERDGVVGAAGPFQIPDRPVQHGSKVSLDLTVPVPGGNPTGQVFNSFKAFPVGGASGSPAIFIVDSDSIGSTQSPGQIEAWDGGAKFVVEDSPTGGPGGKTPKGAIFKGLAIANTKAGPELFATDVANASVDIFNSKFASVSAPAEFKDPRLPAGYAPFGIQALGGKIYISYGKRNAQRTDVLPGAGFGVVDVYSVNGVLLHHLVSNGPASPLNEPWGLAIAPAGFGPFAGDLLVGNLGNGWINAFDPMTGTFKGVLDNSSGYPITIQGLWGLMVGNSVFGGSSSLVFSAGPSGYNDGSVGVIKPG
jgi:uncharacterized protein (TIGR03118 family)